MVGVFRQRGAAYLSIRSCICVRTHSRHTLHIATVGYKSLMMSQPTILPSWAQPGAAATVMSSEASVGVRRWRLPPLGTERTGPLAPWRSSLKATFGDKVRGPLGS
jgi:hypothetical protein